jgi:hypothetical protein
MANELLNPFFNSGANMPPRTIDNLGVDVSTRYAEDKRTLDENILKEARAIPVQTEIEVTTPFFPAELEQLLQVRPTGITWASFPPPPLYFEQRGKLFTSQLIPSMGSEDRQESQVQRIQAKIQSMTEQKTPKETALKDARQHYEQERTHEQEEREKKILVSLLDTIARFDKLIIEINSRRTQYQKG